MNLIIFFLHFFSNSVLPVWRATYMLQDSLCQYRLGSSPGEYQRKCFFLEPIHMQMSKCDPLAHGEAPSEKGYMLMWVTLSASLSHWNFVEFPFSRYLVNIYEIMSYWEVHQDWSLLKFSCVDSSQLPQVQSCCFRKTSSK